MNKPTVQSQRDDPKNGNFSSMFLLGRWDWEGNLFGGNQTNSEMIKLIDDTYKYGFIHRKEYCGKYNNPNSGDVIYNFGRYTHGLYSSGYNIGYASYALKGEIYRDSGIKLYEFKINKSMSSPFSRWEGINWRDSSSPWKIDHAQGG